MKTICEKDYKYVGSFRGWFVFECIKKGFSGEFLFLEEVRYVKNDGSNHFYNSLHPDSLAVFNVVNEDYERYKRLKAYSEAISNSTCVKQHRVEEHNPNEKMPDLTTWSDPTVNHDFDLAKYVVCSL